MKKRLFYLLALTLCLSGCQKAPSQENPSTSYTAGEYITSIKGHNGDMSIKVVFSENEIQSIEVLEHNETLGIADVAITDLPKAIIENQSLAIDNYTGATITSASIKSAVASAVEEAKGDVEALKQKEVVKNIEDITIDTDIVVVGAGGAGLSAAVEASKAGAKVLVVEQNAMQGGSTARSGGKLLATNTTQQEAMGITDNPQDFANYLVQVGENKVDVDKINYIAEQSGVNIAWLEELGVKFNDTLEPLHDRINPTRGHYTLGGGGMSDGKGGSITNALKETAEKTGTEFLFETTANELIVSDGVVTGVIATKKDGSKVTINASSVILATGGYDYNQELFNEFAPKANAGVHTVSPLHRGSGLIMARDAGAQIRFGGGAITLYLDFVTGSYEPSGLYVTNSGERFMDESLFWFTRTKALMDKDAQGMFWITDATADTNGIYDAQVEAGKMFKADSIKELASQIGIDEVSLEATYNRYNELAKNGKDDDFSKPSEYLKEITGTIYAIPFSSVSSGTMGGPLTNMDGQVLDAENNTIDGLYAVGEVSNGDLMNQEYPGSGTSITMCIALGRLTGQKAAEALK